jgi:hypothetical protein
MSLFQKSVLKKHLQTLDKATIEAAWQRYAGHFLDVAKQENIRNSKEEQYQEGFLRELFVDVLGYVPNPSPGFNLTTELKNLGNAKKADGGIVQGEKVLGVIELKGTDTVDLAKVEAQAFGYKSNQRDCRYVVISNFERLRLYVDDATDHEEFDLFELTPDRFRLLYLLLAADYLFADMPARIKQESALQEKDITDKFYKDYSAFKNALFEDLVRRNPFHAGHPPFPPSKGDLGSANSKNSGEPENLLATEVGINNPAAANSPFEGGQGDVSGPADWHLLLFKKSQKLLDRLLFIFFGEDKGLLPPNLIKKTVDDWDRLRDLDEYRPLYDQFKKYFQYIHEGTERKDLSIFAYNGGLFEPDEVLDSVKISDPVLYKYTLELTRYDFDEQVDVNILGHIFEHSLNEIEEISAQLEGTAFDKTQTKRKKDGVFYTPRYITQYIVENTVGRLCTEKKTELGIVEADYAQERKGRRKDVVKALDQRLDAYQQWLFGLKICDPACGSGAFLNEAFDFLIREHGYVAQLRKHLFAEAIPFSVENSILERNIYGVDINEEAVEIARLSLWLRSAEPGRKLTSLSGHIKVGNSLIDDPAVAGEKAFNWEREFPEVFPPKDLQAFHVVLTTHNSRTSQRMINYRVEKGPALWFIPEHEFLITQLIGEVIKDYGFRCMEYMVCADHIHMVLVCEPEELTGVVRTIKSISARKFNLATGRTTPAPPFSPPTTLPSPRGLAPLSADTPSPSDTTSSDVLGSVGARGQAPLEREVDGDVPKKLEKTPSVPVWSQKFYRADLDVWELATLPTKPGYWYESTHLDNAENYIRTNRQKHGLPEVKGLDALIRSFTCTREEAFAPQYKGGFDVVVGNPPYVRQEVISPFKPFFEKAYKTYHGSADLFVYFIEKGITMLKPEGLYSIIVANKWMRANYGKPLRQWLKQRQLVEIVDFGDLPVFADATAYPCVLTVSPKALAENHQFSVTEPTDLSFPSLEQYVKENQFAVSQNGLDDEGWALVNNVKSALLDKIRKAGIPLSEYVQGKIFYGIKTGYNEAFVIDEKTKEELIRKDPKSADIIKPFLAGRDVKRYRVDFDGKYLIRVSKGWTNANRKDEDAWTFFSNTYPSVSAYLIQFQEGAEKRYDKGDYWWELRTCDYYSEFEKPKIITPSIVQKASFTFDERSYYSNDKTNIIGSASLYLLAILNSKLADVLIHSIASTKSGGFFEYKPMYISQIPVKEIKTQTDKAAQQNIETLVKTILELKPELSTAVTQFTRLLRRRFDVEQLPQKLEAWHELSYKEFCAELNKLLQKVHKRKLSIQEDLEWEPLFEEQRAKAAALQADIQRVDREIDGVVYGLYGLGAEEVRIVEGG